MKIKGILTNCITDKESIIDFEYEIREGNRHGLLFKLIGGVTGYESFYIDDHAQENMPKFGWLACSGTEKRWDKLFIPAEEMKKAFETTLPKSTIIIQKQQKLKNLKDQRKVKKKDLYNLDLEIEELEKECLSVIKNKGE